MDGKKDRKQDVRVFFSQRASSLQLLSTHFPMEPDESRMDFIQITHTHTKFIAAYRDGYIHIIGLLAITFSVLPQHYTCTPLRDAINGS